MSQKLKEKVGRAQEETSDGATMRMDRRPQAHKIKGKEAALCHAGALR